MGMKNDLRYRVRHACIDTPESQRSLEKARSYIFKGFKVDGSKVGGIKGMDSESCTPTRVSQLVHWQTCAYDRSYFTEYIFEKT